MIHTVKTNIGGRELIIESGKIAKQAHGAVTVRYGDTIVLSSACASKLPREGIDFFPLTVDYREMTSAAGKFPGGFIKREGRPSEKEVLTCRLIDRPLRPLFPEEYYNEVQVIASVLSADVENDPDVLAIIASSTALAISDIPYKDPVGAVRIGLVEDELVVNPGHSQMEQSRLDLVVAATQSAIAMVEGEAKELPEDKILEALSLAHEEIKKIIQIQKELVDKCGKPKADVVTSSVSKELTANLKKSFGEQIDKAFEIHEKHKRSEYLEDVLSKAKEQYVKEDSDITEKILKQAFEEAVSASTRALMFSKKARVDGRAFDEVRPISCEVGFLPRTHGSALFTRGETQALVITTLGTGDDEQAVDGLKPKIYKKFMFHYNFPPFSVGEVKPMRGVGRREIGHGVLAERALMPTIPEEETFPYTIRVVSIITESNGSSSMASVCGGSLALMDAGVPTKTPVAGIAMGLIKEGEEHIILSDIQGAEDHMGDMDFKVTGTRDGITAVQMDIKISGVTHEIMSKALKQANAGRMLILDKMSEALDRPREELSAYAPRMITIKINPDKIREVIGSGGKVIRAIVDETGAKIDIEDDGTIKIFSENDDAAKKAVEIINGIVEDPEVGKIYKGIVKRIMAFGAFVEIMPGKEGLVHVSQLREQRVENVEDVVKLGDEIMVKLVEIDKQKRLNLSHKAYLKEQK